MAQIDPMYSSTVALLYGTGGNTATFVANNYIRLTTNTDNLSGIAYYALVMGEYWELQYDFQAGGGDGADDIWVAFYDSNNPRNWTPLSGGQYRASCRGTSATGYAFTANEYNSYYRLYGPNTDTGTSSCGPQIVNEISSGNIRDSRWRTAKIIFTVLSVSRIAFRSSSTRCRSSMLLIRL